MSRSTRSSRRTSASCSPRRSARRWPLRRPDQRHRPGASALRGAVYARRVRFRVVASLLAVLGGLAIVAPFAGAADPGRWKLAAVDPLPSGYRGGLSADTDGHVFWSGLPDGLFRGGATLAEQL